MKNEKKTIKPSSANPSPQTATNGRRATGGKKEKMTLEKLARMMAQGFEDTKEELRQEFRQGQTKLEQGQAKLEQGQTKLEQGQAEIKQEVAEIRHEVAGIKEEVSSLKEDQKEIKRAVQSLERKQSGTLASLDETVHRSEFNQLVQRVKVLES